MDLYGNELANIAQIRKYFVRVVFGTASISAVYGRGITVTRTAAGTYTVTLPRQVATCLLVGGGLKRAAGATLQPVMTTVPTTTNGVTTFTLITAVAAGTATEPSTGDELHLELAFTLEGGLA